jgi:diaminohydroxyphosphoribosylaminopyrimidine deaminase/5-amino-6-(5-phosphoribosylamino)uracil reductase
MALALQSATKGLGLVEPNPLVGCVIVRDGELIGTGFHSRFGGPHAEIDALRQTGELARGSTVYVTLEPCCHFGKTPPCTEALIAAGVRRVVIAQRDPNAAVNGAGIVQLKHAGIDITEGVLRESAYQLNAPYRKLVVQGLPWLIAKWAMTWDGKIATHQGDSRWISSQASRGVVHQLRGRVDAVMIGIGTLLADDPLLTARPPGPRLPHRIVVDWEAATPIASRLVGSIASAPVLIAVGEQADAQRQADLVASGCELLVCRGHDTPERLRGLLGMLGARRMTNVLVEGGSGLLGDLFDLRALDEVHVFVAPQLVGGKAAKSPLAGVGLAAIAAAATLRDIRWEVIDHDLYLQGRVEYGT